MFFPVCTRYETVKNRMLFVFQSMKRNIKVFLKAVKGKKLQMLKTRANTLQNVALLVCKKRNLKEIKTTHVGKTFYV